MADSPNGLPPRLLRTQEAARYLGLSRRTLEKHRCYGTGPTYRKLGGRVVYALDDLNSWADQGLRRSTSDPGKGVVHPAKRIVANTPGLTGVGRRDIGRPDSGHDSVHPARVDVKTQTPHQR